MNNKLFFIYWAMKKTSNSKDILKTNNSHLIQTEKKIYE